MNVFRKFLKEEGGQSLIIVALGLVVILGFAAFAIDSGRVHNAQIKVQNATDMAALSAVKGLPDYSSIKFLAEEFAEKNCDFLDSVTVNYPYKGDKELIEVVCTATVPYSFGQILGSKNSQITARSVAGKGSSGGEASPPEADCYPVTTARIHQWPETGRLTYAIQVDSRHQAKNNHTTGKQTLVLCFDRPVTYVSSNGKYTGGNGTCMLSIDYTYHNNPNDNIGLGDVYVKCDGNPKDLKVTSAVTLCEKGKNWPFVAGESTGAGATFDSAVLFE